MTEQRRARLRLTVCWDAIAAFLPDEEADSCTRTYSGWELSFVSPEDVEFVGWPQEEKAER